MDNKATQGSKTILDEADEIIEIVANTINKATGRILSYSIIITDPMKQEDGFLHLSDIPPEICMALHKAFIENYYKLNAVDESKPN